MGEYVHASTLPHADPPHRARRPHRRRRAVAAAAAPARPARSSVDRALVIEAQQFLRGQTLVLGPRKRLPDMKGIPKGEQLADGWALARWGDGGWGGQIRDEKTAGHFSDELVDALVELLAGHPPDPPFEWVTAVPSRRAPELVPSLGRARRRQARPALPAGAGEGARHAAPGRDGEQRAAGPQRRWRVRRHRAAARDRGPDRRRRVGLRAGP